MHFFLAVIYFVLAAGLVFFVAFFLPSRFVNKATFLMNEPNVLPGLEVADPAEGIVSISYDYLRGIDGKIPEEKAKSKAVATLEEGHHLISIGFILFRTKKGKHVPVGTALYQYEEPFRMDEKAEFVFPKKTSGLAVMTRRLDDVYQDSLPMAKPKMLWTLLGALIGALGITAASFLGYFGILTIFAGPNNPFSYLYGNLFALLIVLSSAFGGGFVAEFLALFFYGRSKGFRGK